MGCLNGNVLWRPKRRWEMIYGDQKQDFKEGELILTQVIINESSSLLAKEKYDANLMCNI